MATPQTRNFLGRHSSKLALGVLALGGTYLYVAAAPPKPKGTVEANPMRTPGVKNIETAYQRAGATSTDTKAYGGEFVSMILLQVLDETCRVSQLLLPEIQLFKRSSVFLLSRIFPLPGELSLTLVG